METDPLESMQRLRSELPEIMGSFSGLHEAAFGEGALGTKVKRLIAVGISVALRCEPCIRVHVRGAVEAGASREEILEAAGCGILMGGGPSAAYTALYLLEEMDRLTG